MNKTRLLLVAAISAALVGSSLVLAAAPVWTAPTQPFPNGSPAAPIDTSNITQPKSGALNLGKLDLGILNTSVTGINLGIDQFLNSNGNVFGLSDFNGNTTLENSGAFYINSLLGLVLPRPTSVPTATSGTIYYDNNPSSPTYKTVQLYNGTSWQAIGSGGGSSQWVNTTGGISYGSAVFINPQHGGIRIQGDQTTANQFCIDDASNASVKYITGTFNPSQDNASELAYYSGGWQVDQNPPGSPAGSVTCSVASSASKVGIGTAAPGYSLDVNGAINATAYYLNGSPQWANMTGGINYNGGKVRTTNTSGNPEMQLQYGSGTNDHWGIYTNQSDKSLNIWGEVTNLNVGANIVSITPSSYQGVTTLPAKFTVNGQMCIGASCISSWPNGGGGSQWDNVTGGINYAGGNVGIGTSTPSTKLDVFQDINGTNIFRIDNPNAGANAISMLQARDGSGKSISIMQTGPGSTQNGALAPNAGSIGANGAGGLNLYTFGTNPIIFYTNGFDSTAEKMRITSTGNVGIGTAIPGAKLDVAGVINGRNFEIPATGGTSQWADIGKFTAGQTGHTILITAFIHEGYNAVNHQDSTYYISFKTSNNTSCSTTLDGGQTNASGCNGFAGNGSWYAIGDNSSIGPGDIKWVANAGGVAATSYDLYIRLPVYTENSHYSVTVVDSASWSNVGAIGQSDPGSASASVLIPSVDFNIPQGYVGIGTNNPQDKLSVEGGNVFINGGNLKFQTISPPASAPITSVNCGGTNSPGTGNAWYYSVSYTTSLGGVTGETQPSNTYVSCGSGVAISFTVTVPAGIAGANIYRGIYESGHGSANPVLSSQVVSSGAFYLIGSIGATGTFNDNGLSNGKSPSPVNTSAGGIYVKEQSQTDYKQVIGFSRSGTNTSIYMNGQIIGTSLDGNDANTNSGPVQMNWVDQASSNGVGAGWYPYAVYAP